MGEKTMSMFEKVNEHDNDIKEHRERIGSLEEITLALKQSDRQHDERLKQLEDNAMKLENTVMIENRDTRTTMKEQVDKLFVLLEKNMDHRSTVEAYNHDQKMAKLKTWADVFMKVLLGLTGAGGIGYLIVQHFLNQVGGN